MREEREWQEILQRAIEIANERRARGIRPGQLDETMGDGGFVSAATLMRHRGDRDDARTEGNAIMASTSVCADKTTAPSLGDEENTNVAHDDTKDDSKRDNVQ